MGVITIQPGPFGHVRMFLTDLVANDGKGQSLPIGELTGGSVTVANGTLVRATSRRIVGELSIGFQKWTDAAGVVQSLHSRFDFTVNGNRTLVVHYDELFNAEIKAVDPTKSLTYIIDPTYAEMEFSYSGLTIRGGSRLACEYGAGELLEVMGFRCFSSAAWGTVRPATIPTNLTRARGFLWMKSNSLSIAYNHGWPDAVPVTAASVTSLDASELIEAQNRFEVLNGLNGSAYPTGHRWDSVISSNLAWFQAIPPGGTEPRGARMIRGGMNKIPPIAASTDGASFNIDVGHLTTAEYDELVHLCAATLLWDGAQQTDIGRTFQEFHRDYFDPSDGDQNTSDTVYPFCKAVAAKMRAGVTAISNKPAAAGVPDTQLGVYGYAGHELAPTNSCAPEIYIGGALAFKGAFNPDTFEEWCRKLWEKAAFGTIRDYWDTMLWSRGMPMNNVRICKTYMNQYDAFVANGCAGMSTEFGANWLANIIGTRWGIRKIKTGGTTWNDALNDALAKLFNNDPKVAELYDTLWGETGKKFNKYNLRYSFDIVNAMAASWYKTLFKQYLVICKRHLYLPLRTLKANNPSWPAPAPGDPFPAKFLELMKNIVALRMQEPLQAWGYVGVYANTFVSQDYPDLWSGRKNNNVATRPNNPIAGYPTYTTDPDYFTNPVAPSEQDWLDEYAAITADTQRDIDLDRDATADLVLVRGIVPNVKIYDPATHADAPHFHTEQSSMLGFIGPGSVIFKDADNSGQAVPVGVTDVETYGPGFHHIETLTRQRLASNVGGELFLNSFPSCFRRYHQPVQTYQFLYIHGRTQTPAPHVAMAAKVRWSFHDDSGTRFDLAPSTDPAWKDPKDLGPGQIMIDNVQSSDVFVNDNVNKWISKKANIALLPRVIADEDYPNKARVHVVP